MSAYMVFNYTVTNQEGYDKYLPAAMPTLRPRFAEVLVADNNSEAKEGSPGQVTVVLRFDSKAAARAWYESEAYQAAKPLRTSNTEGVAALCKGFLMPT
jgi:uncharacterized protein (DUF1330 family)